MGERTITAKTDLGQTNTTIDNYPDTCPSCFHSVEPRLVATYLFDNELELEIVFQCPRNDCRHLFIAYYIYYGAASLSLAKVAPVNHQPRMFSPQIISASDNFVKIYNQANHSEALNLSDIAGAGYRKALEFLIKDYSIGINPDQANIIKNKQLSKVISDHIADTNIKSTAKRAAWLGNDETHYYRKWEDKDIKDLKILIELTVRWIESELLTREYEQTMTD